MDKINFILNHVDNPIHWKPTLFCFSWLGSLVDLSF